MVAFGYEEQKRTEPGISKLSEFSVRADKSHHHETKWRLNKLMHDVGFTVTLKQAVKQPIAKAYRGQKS